MTAQWPQQIQAPPNQHYISYPHQYPPQSNPNGAYNPQYQPNPQMGPIQQQPQPGPNSCYNCGAAEHWAQDCPEPRRENPVGLIYRQNQARPFKRQKPNAPIITKYPVPPHVQQHNGPAPVFGGVQYVPPSYAPQRGPYGLPTPLSTISPSQPQWQSTQYPHYQQPYQQNQYHHNGHYQQNSYPTPTAQTPSSYYSTNNNSHQGSPQGPPYGPNMYPQQNQISQPAGFQGSAVAVASTVPAISPSNGYPLNRPSEGKNSNSASPFPGAYPPSEVAKSYSVTPKPFVADLANNGTEEEDLYALDIPDLPSSSRNLTDQIIISGGALIRLFGRPLPANFVVADAILPIEPPQREDEGRCQSKYWGRGSSEKLVHIKETKDWSDFERDPIFSFDSNDNGMTPLDNLNFNDPQNDAKGSRRPSEATAEDRELSPGHKRRDAWEVVDSLERALSNESNKQPNTEAAISNVSMHKSSPPKDTELLLAALGVTGAPKPVRAPARPYPPPLPDHAKQGSAEQFCNSRSKSPTKGDTDGQYNRDSMSHSGVRDNYQSHDPNDISGHPTYYNHKQIASGETAVGRNGSIEMPNPQSFGPPPPSPASLRHHSDTSNGTPSDINLENGNGYVRYAVDGHPATPNKMKPERSNGRKREYDSRDSSDESETPRRRQADDVTPKLKRRQPKVDAAYSRRW